VENTSNEQKVEKEFREYIKSLSETECDAAVAIEAELGKILEEGWTEEIAFKFVRTVLEVRKVMPESTVWGIFNWSFLIGVNFLLKYQLPELKSGAPTKRRKAPRGKLAGAGV